MQNLGYPVVLGSKIFFSKQRGVAVGLPECNIDAAYRYAQKLGWPVFVKPNSASRGAGVMLVYNRVEFYKAIRKIFQIDQEVLVQPPVQGREYRFVVLGDRVVCVYEAIPLNIIGDGTSTILSLLNDKQRQFLAIGRQDAEIKIDDSRMAWKLKRQGLTLSSVPSKGKRVHLLDNSNLCTGGDIIDVTKQIHPSFKQLAVNLTKDMGLRLCGVDIMTDGDITKTPDKYCVIEINSSPGLEQYFCIGETQRKVVRDMYVEVLAAMEHK